MANTTREEALDFLNRYLSHYPLQDYSHARYLYTQLLNREARKAAGAMMDEMGMVPADTKQAQVILAGDPSAPELIRLLRKDLRPQELDLLTEKLCEKKEEVLPILSEKMLRTGNQAFIDNTLHFLLNGLGQESLPWIHPLYPQLRSEELKSSLCLLFGFFGTMAAIPFLMEETRRMKALSNVEALEQGPLIALYELRERIFRPQS